MNQIRSIDFLPEVFRTDTNEKFLTATLDQLIQEPELKRVQGFIGRTKTALLGEYISEPNALRQHTQLEPAVIIQPDTAAETVVTYPEMLSALKNYGAYVDRPDRLFNAEYYAWDPMIDFDKFVNFSQYYWLPSGPDSVNVSASVVPISQTFEFSESTGYVVKGFSSTNPKIQVLRGGEYNFSVNHPNRKLYIQTEPGVNGTYSFSNNISTRDVFGVTDNGMSDGEIKFSVPDATAQDAFFSMPEATGVDLITGLQFVDIQGVQVERFVQLHGGFDGITEFDGLTLVFKPQTEGWLANEMYDGIYDQQPPTEVPVADRYKVWKIQYKNIDNTNYINLVLTSDIAIGSKFKIIYGQEESNRYYYKAPSGEYARMPLLTAHLTTLYYQDATDPLFFGEIEIIDELGNQTINVFEDIVGKKTYTSGNGVTLTNGLKIQLRGNIIPESYKDQAFYVEGVGSSISLVPVKELLTPEPYAISESEKWDDNLYDELPYDASLNRPKIQDYLTVNRASADRNAWSRSNRWFHIDVIEATSEYNKFVPVLDNTLRATRPIIEFNANMSLFNHGSVWHGYVDIIDFNAPDALSDLAGIYYDDLPEFDGFKVQNGSRIIFANDADATVRNKIFEIRVVKLDAASSELYTTVVPVGDIADRGSVVCLRGDTLRGKTFQYTNETWKPAQQKNSVNQPPLFDLVDSAGVSVSDQSKYLSSSFSGTKLFGYGLGTGAPDKVLKFPLKYQTINNVGDIVFVPYYFTDTYSYVADGQSQVGQTRDVYVYDYNAGKMLNGWQKSVSDDLVWQVFAVNTAANTYVADVPALLIDNEYRVKVYVNGQYLSRSSYTLQVTDQETVVTFNTEFNDTDTVELYIKSNSASAAGRYTVPLSLENNSFNETPSSFTLGALRKHYSSAVEDLSSLAGTLLGKNNSRDLGNYIPFGKTIIQHSAPAALVPVLTAKTRYNMVSAVEYAAREYEKIKGRILDAATQKDFGFATASDILDEIIDELTVGRTPDSPFYWSDMLPAKVPARVTELVIDQASSNIIDTASYHGDTTASYSAVLVYRNGVIQTRGVDYTVATDGPRIVLLFPLIYGDVVVVKEYEETFGACIPDTPTKLGLYPAYLPEKFVDNTYKDAVEVLRGHDGSITVAFGDVRDDVLLEFETRIYNNLKFKNRNDTLLLDDVVSTVFRQTAYTEQELQLIVEPSFISWVNWHRLEYSTQEFSLANEFSWNYSGATSKLDGKPLAAFWRQIYYDYYGTDTPHISPWEMLGFSERPEWWYNMYGTAPYTSGNQVLWDDIEAGFIAEPGSERHDARYARAGIYKVLPVDDQGNLLSPLHSVVAEYDAQSIRKDWKITGGSPVWAAWRKSSAWPFVVQKALMLTRPAVYFANSLDKDLNRRSDVTGQLQYGNTRRIQIKNLTITDGVARHSYINWLADYARLYGIDVATDLTNRFATVDLRLAYRVAGFTDKKYMQVLVEQTSPTSTNTSAVLPDESYKIKLHTNVAELEVEYSSVIVQKTTNGFKVSGFNDLRPYFKIYPPILNSNANTYTDFGAKVTIPRDFATEVRVIPYGYEFVSVDAVVNFLVGYGKYLTSAGFVFEDIEQNTVLDWAAMAREMVQWSYQNWPVGSLINLNPAANVLRFTHDNLVVDSLLNLRSDQLIVDQGKQPLKVQNLYVNRVGHRFDVSAADGNLISGISLNLVAREHVILFDNRSVFGDVIYEPVTGLRQQRLKIQGFVTDGWDGHVNAPGFMLNEETVLDWAPNKRYSKGQIVLYKNQFWSAAETVEPSEVFNFAQWKDSDYEKAPRGLLPNIATKAEQSRNFYNNKLANLDQDIDLLSFGITGFRPRKYLTDIALSDVSQVEVYSEFIKGKGTQAIASMFNNTTVDSSPVGYSTYDNWAIKTAQYGATANRRYIEIELNEDKLQANPSIIEVIEPGEKSVADQTLAVSQLFKSSSIVGNSNIFPLKAAPDQLTSFPTAGFASLDETDVQIFSLDDLTELSANINKLRYGTMVWVAKANRHQWDIYKTEIASAQLLRVYDALNGLCVLFFDQAHNLEQNEIIVIRDFDSRVDGAYRITAVLEDNAVAVTLSLPDKVVEIVNNGAVFVLRSQLVDSMADIGELFIDRPARVGERVWIKNTGHNKWGVVERTEPFVIDGQLSLTYFENNQGTGTYGNKVKVTDNGRTIIVADPTTKAGGAYVYGEIDGTVVETEFVTLTGVPDLAGLGYSLATAAGNWLVMGAPTHNTRGSVAVFYKPDGATTYSPRQLLSPVDGSEYGFSAAISDDSQWMFVGAPASRKVYAYKLVDVDRTPMVEYSATGTADTFDLNFTAQYASQVIVVVNNVATTSFSLIDSGKKIQLAVTPAAGSTVRILKRAVTTAAELVGKSLDEMFVDYSGPESVTVFRNGAPLILGVDYTITSSTSFSLPTDATVEIGSHYKLQTVITNASVPSFGYSIDTSGSGDYVIVGAPNYAAGGISNSGAVFVYPRNDYNEWVSGVDGIQTISAVEGTTFALNQTFVQPEAKANANFGYSVRLCNTSCSIYVGAPGYDNDNGVVERFVNEARVNGIIASAPISTITWPANSTLYINGFAVSTGASAAQFVNNIVAVPVPNVTADMVDDRVVIRIVSRTNAEELNLLSIRSNVAGVVNTLGFESLKHAQTITPPPSALNGRFGHDIVVNKTSTVLFIAAPTASATVATTFDRREFTLDYDSTSVYDVIEESGAVFSYDLLIENVNDNTKSKFVLGQQITNYKLSAGDHYGWSLDVSDNNVLVASAPGTDLYRRGKNFYTRPEAIAIAIAESAVTPVFYANGSTLEPDNFVKTTDAGRVVRVIGSTSNTAWKTIRNQRDIVDIDRINTLYLYDKNTQRVIQDLDYIDPIQGKILGVARQNLDYIAAHDPAQYNNGTQSNNGRAWGKESVGQLWWYTENARFVDYYDVDIKYSAYQWNKLFPGSSIAVYEWIESDVPPWEYTGTYVFSTDSYTSVPVLNSAGVFETKYYFWALNTTTVNRSKNKTLSAATVARYIANPKTAGIPFVALVNESAIGLYNCNEYLKSTDIALHVEFEDIETYNNVHVEYELIAEGQPSAFLPARLFRKFVDSLCGVDTLGNSVPDRSLAPSEMYGVLYRPRQSMFVDRFAALENYISKVNSVLLQYPIRETKVFHLLNSFDPIPTVASGAWDKRLLSIVELEYQDHAANGVGFKYLVESDASNAGRWSIYEVTPELTVKLSQVQYYDTRQYWDYVDWYAVGYAPGIKPTVEVNFPSELSSLNVTDRTVARARTNGTGHWELHEYRDGSWTRIAVEKGTIQLASKIYDYSRGNYGFDLDLFDSSYFDQEPVMETRRILEAINYELLVDDLLVERNAALMLMFNYILSEHPAPEWLVKTSLIDVEHNVRTLKQDEFYKKDNQDFVMEFLNEVKPFHTKIREFSANYSALDIANGTYTDFDVPSYYNTVAGKFISPVLTTGGLTNTNEHPIDSAIWQTQPWSQWFENTSLSLEAVTVVNGGAGYTARPIIEVVGNTADPAVLEAVISSAGELVGVKVIHPGSGYYEAPVLNVVGGNGTGAKLVPVIAPSQVRSFEIELKFDRYDYAPTITTYNGEDIGSLSAADRIAHFYKPATNQPGNDLGQLMPGTRYDGIWVYGNEFNTELDSPYNFNPLNHEYDTFFESEFGESTESTAPGGEFIDSTHAYGPEELMPGIAFDTMDLLVEQRPGADWFGSGFAFEAETLVARPMNGQVEFDGLVPVPSVVRVVDLFTGSALVEGVDYTVDWPSLLVKDLSVSDRVRLHVYGIGGGNQLFKDAFIVDDSIMFQLEDSSLNAEIVVPASTFEIVDVVALRNGERVVANWEAIDNYQSTVSIPGVSLGDYVSLVVFGASPYRAALPDLETVNAVSGQDTYVLSSTLNYTNAIDAIVELNGRRLRPADSVKYLPATAMGTFAISPTAQQYQASIIEADIWVYVGGIRKQLSVDYTVNLAAGTITLNTATTSSVIVSVQTRAEYRIVGSNLEVFVPVATGDVLSVMSWGDTRELVMETRVFQGPKEVGYVQEYPFDSAGFSQAPPGVAENPLLNEDFGKFDYYEDLTALVNRFDLGRNDLDNTRLWVTVNGKLLRPDVDYHYEGTELVISGPTVAATDVIVVSTITRNTVPMGMTYRIFQDMRGVAGIYKTTKQTYLVQPLTSTDTVIVVDNARALTNPAATERGFGVLVVNGERITYRNRNVTTNTLSGLRRGTAGTAAANHSVRSTVIDMAATQKLDIVTDITYDKVIVKDNAETPEDETVTQTVTEPFSSYYKSLYADPAKPLNLQKTPETRFLLGL